MDFPAHSKAMTVRRLEKQAPANGRVMRVEVVRHERADRRSLLFVQGTVAGVENRARRHFIHREKVGQEPTLRAVELLEEPHSKMLVELIRALRVDDVNGVDPFA